MQLTNIHTFLDELSVSKIDRINDKQSLFIYLLKTIMLAIVKFVYFEGLWSLMIFLGITDQGPSVFESNRLHVVIFWDFCIGSRYIHRFF